MLPLTTKILQYIEACAANPRMPLAAAPGPLSGTVLADGTIAPKPDPLV